MSEFENIWKEKEAEYWRQIQQQSRITERSEQFISCFGTVGSALLKQVVVDHVNKNRPSDQQPLRLPPSIPGQQPSYIDQKLAEAVRFLVRKFEENTDQSGGECLLR